MQMDEAIQPGRVLQGTGTLRTGKEQVAVVRYRLAGVTPGRLRGTAILVTGSIRDYDPMMTLELEDGRSLPVRASAEHGRFIRLGSPGG